MASKRKEPESANEDEDDDLKWAEALIGRLAEKDLIKDGEYHRFGKILKQVHDVKKQRPGSVEAPPRDHGEEVMQHMLEFQQRMNALLAENAAILERYPNEQ